MTYKKYIEIMTKKTMYIIVNCFMDSKYQILHPGAINTFYYRVVTIIYLFHKTKYVLPN